MLIKKVTQDKIEIVGPFRMIQVRTKTTIIEDGVEISSNFSRHIVVPGGSLTKETQEIKDIASVMHTAKIKDAYAAFQLMSL